MDVAQAAARLKQRWDDFYQSSRRPQECIECGGPRVWWDGHHRRSASVLVGCEVVFFAEVRCRRAKCAECSKRWIVRPPGLVPHRHYQPCVVAKALGEYLFDATAAQATVSERFGCAPRTVGRWRDWVGGLAAPALLQALVVEVADAPLLPRLFEVGDLERKGRSLTRRAALQSAALVLGLLEALGCAQGCEPPGLRGVLEFVVGDRGGMTTGRCPSIPEFAFRQAYRGIATISV